MAAAVFVLVCGSRTAYAAAFVIGLSALGAVLLYRYANVPALGPLPAMNEPLWSPEKILSSIAEAFAAVIGAAMLISKVDQAGSVIGRRPGCWPDLEDDHWSTGQEGGSPLRATSGVQHLVDSAY